MSTWILLIIMSRFFLTSGSNLASAKCLKRTDKLNTHWTCFQILTSILLLYISMSPHWSLSLHHLIIVSRAAQSSSCLCSAAIEIIIHQSLNPFQKSLGRAARRQSFYLFRRLWRSQLGQKWGRPESATKQQAAFKKLKLSLLLVPKYLTACTQMFHFSASLWSWETPGVHVRGRKDGDFSTVL